LAELPVPEPFRSFLEASLLELAFSDRPAVPLPTALSSLWLDDPVPCGVFLLAGDEPACATPVRKLAANHAPASSKTTTITRRRHDHPVASHVVAGPRHPSRPVDSGTTLVPEDRPRLPPTNTSRSVVALIGVR
jgi:hypothetical protein